MSLEHEYGHYHPTKKNLRDLAYLIFDQKTHSIGIVSNRNHLSNGGQLYIDIGSHIEIALPECTNPLDVVIYDEASSKILTNLAEENDINIYKNNLDFRGNSFGCHENYYVSLDSLIENYPKKDKYASFQFQNEIKDKILPFLFTRQIFTGSGYISQNKYLLSQRSTVIKKEFGTGTQMYRPIFNIRDEPFSYSGLRIHLINSDSNISEFSNYLKLGTTALVLTMIENGFLKKSRIKYDAISVLNQINNEGINSIIPDPFKFLKKTTPIKIQRLYLNQAKEFFSINPAVSQPYTDSILNDWQFTLDALEEDYNSLNRHIDWIIKKDLIDTFQKHNKNKVYNQSTKNIDLQYHLINSHGYNFRESIGLKRILKDNDIEHAMQNSPKDTRAYARTQLLKKFLTQKEKNIKCCWDKVTCINERHYLLEPFRTYENLLS